LGYPTAAEEIEILQRRRERRSDDIVTQAVLSPETVRAMQTGLEGIHVEEAVEQYIVELVTRTRRHPQVEVGASPRGSLALLKLGRARAALRGRDFVVPDDVKSIAIAGLAHRLILKPDPWVKGVQGTAILAELLEKVPVPKVD